MSRHGDAVICARNVDRYVHLDDSLESDHSVDSDPPPIQDPTESQVSAGNVVYTPAPPPPTVVYPSRSAAADAWTAWGLRHKCAYVTKGTWRNKAHETYKILLYCEQYGKWEKRGNNKRKTKSKRSGCEHSFYATACDVQAPNGPWTIRHRQLSKFNEHNHVLKQDSSMFTAARRAQWKESGFHEHFMRNWNDHMSPDESARSLRSAFPHSLITTQDVKNRRTRFSHLAPAPSTHLPLPATTLPTPQMHGVVPGIPATPRPNGTLCSDSTTVVCPSTYAVHTFVNGQVITHVHVCSLVAPAAVHFHAE
jgi:hypothetical protein